MNEFYIPTNFEDSGKIMGLFRIRNVVEAVVLSLPFIYLTFNLISVSLTMKIIVSALFVVPISGFSLMGINDDPLSVFVIGWWQWFRKRRVIEYRGDGK